VEMSKVGVAGRDHPKKRWTTEDCWVLDIAELPLRGRVPSQLPSTALVSRISGPRRAVRVRYTMTTEGDGTVLRLAHNAERGRFGDEREERIGLLITEPNFGGIRWWFSCPLSKEGKPCKRRVAKLYLPPGGRRFGCRGCHELTYRSCRRSHRYDRICKIMSGGCPEVEEELKRAFRVRAREGRRRALQTPFILFELFDEPSGTARPIVLPNRVPLTRRV
jgi:hypothetical protein